MLFLSAACRTPALQYRTGTLPRLFGTPYPEAFTVARAGMGAGHHAMIGDTRQTDIPGGQAARIATILVTAHGLFAGHDTAPLIAQSGIVPDFALPSI